MQIERRECYLLRTCKRQSFREHTRWVNKERDELVYFNMRFVYGIHVYYLKLSMPVLQRHSVEKLSNNYKNA